MTATVTMYRQHLWKVEIEAVQVVKVTPGFVTVLSKDWQGKPAHTKRKRDGYYETWSACKAAIVASWERRVEMDKQELQRSRSTLGSWEALKESA